MIQVMKHLVLFPILILFISCTDGRKREIQYIKIRTLPKTDMKFITQFYPINNTQNTVYQMTVKDNSLFLTGTPFGFARYDIMSNPENPNSGKVFVVKEQLGSFIMYRREPENPTEFSQPAWTVEDFASRALGILGNIVFLGGNRGLSVVDISETHIPREIRRFPKENEDLDIFKWIRDEAYVYRAIVTHPLKPTLYAFREQDYVYTLTVDYQHGLRFLRKDSYLPNSTMCCVRGATWWQNKIFVAFQSKLVYFDISEDNRLINGTEINELQATSIASTPQYLFVMHEPTYGNLNGINHPRGIYVFDRTGRQVALLTAHTTKVFAVHPNNTYLYANDDNSSINIYKINWINKY